MVVYTCNNCLKKFNRKSSYNYHINRKFPCKKIIYNNNIIDDICVSNIVYSTKNDSQRITNESQKITNESQKIKNKEKVKHECNYCNKTFSTNSNLRRHKRLYCKILENYKFNETDLLKKEIDILKNKINNQNKKIIKLINKNNIINNENSYNTNNSFNTINNIVKFGDEDLDYITNNIYKKIMNKGYQSVPQLINYIHFNKDKPENHNLLKTNMRDNKISIYDGEKFILVDKQHVLEQLYDTKSEIIEMKFDEIKDDLPNTVIKKISRFIRDKDDDKHKTLLLKDIDFLTYNNRHIPLNTKNKRIKN